MHYKDGTQIKLGDIAKGKTHSCQHEVLGKIVGMSPDSETCNVFIAYVGLYTPVMSYICKDGSSVYTSEKGDSNPHVVASIGVCTASDLELVVSAPE